VAEAAVTQPTGIANEAAATTLTSIFFMSLPYSGGFCLPLGSLSTATNGVGVAHKSEMRSCSGPWDLVS